ncbi:mycofactocin biosynthesis glycosyltransferase MftF [Streptomyces sp. NPDC054786]
MTEPLPPGFRIVLDPATRRHTAQLWTGGSPTRALRLTTAGRAAWREVSGGPVVTRAAGELARRFTDAGLAHPCPPEPTGALNVTVVIPVRDRAPVLDRCLTALGHEHSVIVVDDASQDAQAVAETAARHGATLLRRAVNGGPGPARDTALPHITTDLVAFVDSDCLPAPGWLRRLAAHFADPMVAAVAPRIVGVAPRTWAGRYTTANGSLDLGDQPARVVPGTRVGYVPTATLVARRAALLDVARDGRVFDPALRFGEDVDLVWRLHAGGWRIRYDPGVRIGHAEPATWRRLLARHFRYGTSAAPLSRRHPEHVPPLVLRGGHAAVVSALLAGWPGLAAAAFCGSAGAMARTLHAAGLPARGAVPGTLAATGHTWVAVGRYGTQFAAPVLLALAAAPGGRTPARRRARRAAWGSLLLGPPLAAWAVRRSGLDPVRFALGGIMDDIAYGLGVWAGCITERTTLPLRPRLLRRPTRPGTAPRTRSTPTP